MHSGNPNARILASIRAGRNGLRTVLLILALAASDPAQSDPGRCLLQVNGRTYLDSVCNIDGNPADESFSIGTGEHSRSKYFAYVNIEADGTAQGYWNGISAESHAHKELGRLVRQGECWVNDHARVCASRTSR